jgi:tripartite-type tricarboxylate transporter receptor subunit TctC
MFEQTVNRRVVLELGIAAGILAGSVGRSAAQAISRPARLLVGFPAGGSIDTVARLLVEQMKDYAPSLIVENRVGAGGRLALDALKRSHPDGATFAISPGDQITLFPHIYRKLSYDPLRDFIPVTAICTFPYVIAVGPMVPQEVRTLSDFADWCRANPQRASFGSAGAGTRQHFLGSLFAQAAKAEIAHIPFSGGAPALQAVLGSQIPSVITVLANALPHLQSGSLRALATTAPVRSGVFPDIPTAREAGFATIEAVEWFGIFLPATVPAQTVDQLAQAVGVASEKPPVRAALTKQAFDSSTVRGEAFSNLIREETKRWGNIVSETGFTPVD